MQELWMKKIEFCFGVKYNYEKNDWSLPFIASQWGWKNLHRCLLVTKGSISLTFHLDKKKKFPIATLLQILFSSDPVKEKCLELETVESLKG